MATWAERRPRWAWGHVVVFALQLLGSLALVGAVLLRERRRVRPAAAHAH